MHSLCEILPTLFFGGNCGCDFGDVPVQLQSPGAVIVPVDQSSTSTISVWPRLRILAALMSSLRGFVMKLLLPERKINK